MPTRKTKTTPRPPWFDDGRPELWVTVTPFALLMNRSRMTIYDWYANGTLKDFGYRTYRDLTGRLFIRIQETDFQALTKIRKVSQSRLALRERSIA